MDNRGSALIVLLLGDPHLLEGGEGGQDGATDPDGVLPLRGSDDLDLDGGGGEGGDLLLHPVSNTGVHGGAARHDSVGVQVLADVHVALHDGVEGGLVDAAGLHAQEGGGLEQSLGAQEPLLTDGDDRRASRRTSPGRRRKREPWSSLAQNQAGRSRASPSFPEQSPARRWL